MQAAGRFATGNTVGQLEVVSGDSNGQLLAPFWIDALEVGRKPTPPGAATSDPPMIQRIQEWCAAKGIDSKAAWAIKKGIDKNGYPGKPGVLSTPLGDDNINSRVDVSLNQLGTLQAQQLADLFNIFD